ncbi:unnamed protein product [Cochlearia groenlandica]
MKMKSSSSSSPSLSLCSKTQTFGCISLILQRFLCSGSSSTYPSDQITEITTGFGSEPPIARGDKPGAVARLMGLDSVPVIDKTRVVSRSRSVSSVEYTKRENSEIHEKQRRVKSTMDSNMFIEYVELEDDNFFILSFEKDKHEKGLGELKTRKCKKRRELIEEHRETENQTHMEGKENNINAMNVSPRHERLGIGELKQRRKQERNSRRKRKELKLRQNIDKDNWAERYVRSKDGDLVNCGVTTIKEEEEEEEEECGSCDDSSPVSVLDLDWFSSVRASPSSLGISSRRPLSSELESNKLTETDQEDHITPTSRLNIQQYSYQEMWLKICGLTVSEIEGTNWVYENASKLEDLEGNVSEDIATNILDQLLEETITTLSLTSQV